MFLSDVWRLYETDKKLEGYSENTINAYKLQHRLFVDYYGDALIGNVTYDDIKGYLAKDAARLKPSSIAFRMKFFRSLWRYAIDEGIITENPASRLKNPKEGKRIPKYMSMEDIETMRIACKSIFESAMLEMFFASGCRISEINQIDINDIDWQDKSIKIIGKGNKERVVFFDTRCAVILKKYLSQRKDNVPALFVTERKYEEENGQPRRMSNDGMRWTLNRISERAGVENVHPHRLRHSFAMHMLKNGAPLEVIQSFLGHSSIETTRIYADHNTEMRRDLYRKYF